MTNQQKRERNWQKARLMGMTFNTPVFSERERVLVLAIIAAKNELIEDWDRETAALIGHPLKPYKCCWCGRRGNVKHEFRGDTYCFKHYNEIDVR